MRKSVAMLGAAALLTIFPATPALAEGATVTKDGVCYAFIPNGSGGLTSIVAIGEALTRTNNSGNTTMTCHFDLEEGQAPTKAARARGFPCETPIGLTYDTRINASTGGRMVMTCRNRP